MTRQEAIEKAAEFTAKYGRTWIATETKDSKFFNLMTKDKFDSSEYHQKNYSNIS